jgi:predicted small secreted protein
VFVPSNPQRGSHRAFEGENIVTTMKPWTLLFGIRLLGSAGATLSGCNTSEGFGKDVESVGEDIQDEAQEAK